jgi:peptidoglycan/LPS O-acetylase OafA/YrhL
MRLFTCFLPGAAMVSARRGRLRIMNKAAEGRMATLDGMRGVAALLVVLHHAGPMAAEWALLPRGYLAVDFFFMLSGFVMSRAYEDRFRAGLSLTSFLKARLRRLYPVMSLGIVSGALVASAGSASATGVAALLVAELCFIPQLGGGMRGVYRSDGVQWSLLFELVANVAHQTVLRRLGTRALILLAGLAGIVLIATARHFGTVALGDRGMNFFGGLPRIFFPYITGIVLDRLGRAGRLTGPAPSGLACVALLLLTLLTAGLVPSRWDGWWIEAGTVMLVFPVLIAWGAQGVLEPRHRAAAAAAGALSYPLYAMHLPAINLALLVFGGWFGHGPLLLGIALALALGAALLAQHLVARFDASTGRKPRAGATAIPGGSSAAAPAGYVPTPDLAAPILP